MVTEASVGTRLNMLPILSSNNKVYSGPINAVTFSKRSSLAIFASVFFSYFQNIFFSKNAVPMFLSRNMRRATASVTPIFINRIELIVSVCSNKQMIGVYTRRIITFMTNYKTFWYFAIKAFPRKSVGFLSLTFNSKIAIAFISLCAGPQPARIGFIDFTPKSIHALSIAQNDFNCQGGSYFAT